MGDELWPADVGNPKGYFEDREVNNINDELIAPVAPKTPPSGLRRLLLGDIPILGHYQHWVAVLRPSVSISCPPAMSERIAAVDRAPALLLQGSEVFVHPDRLAAAYRRNSAALRLPRPERHGLQHGSRMQARRPHAGAGVDERWALKVWEAMYRYILDVHYRQGGDWLFLHYDQMLDHSMDEELERRLGAGIDREFAVAELNRSRPGAAVPRRMARLYERLCALARYDPERGATTQSVAAFR